MKTKSISIHVIPLFTWIMGIVVYIYSQNNLFSCVFVLALLAYLSRNYVKMSWKALVYSWMLVSLSLMVFYGLFLHHGNNVAGIIPGNIPLISGLVTWNSILYGFFLGGSLSLSLFTFSLFSHFLRQQRPKFFVAGIGANLSILFSFLSYFVAYFLNHHQTFEQKIHNRALKVSALKKVRLFMHDSAFHAMENAFVFAETLEMRGFSLSRKKSNLALDLMVCVWSFSLLMFLVLYRLQHHLWQLLGAVISFVILTILLRKFKKRSVVTQKIKTKFHIVDTVLMGWSLTFVVFSLIHTFLAQSYLSKESIQLYLLFDPVTHAFFIAHACIGILCLNSKRTKS